MLEYDGAMSYVSGPAKVDPRGEGRRGELVEFIMGMLVFSPSRYRSWNMSAGLKISTYASDMAGQRQGVVVGE